MQIKVSASWGMPAEWKAYYNKYRADSDLYKQENANYPEFEYESKETLGVYELSWGADKWPVVNLEKTLTDGCAKAHYGIVDKLGKKDQAGYTSS